MRIAITVAALAALATAASANAANLVSNGSFESSAYTVNHEFGVAFGGQGVTDWTATLPTGISFYFFGGTASTVSPINRFGDGNAMLATSYPGPSPDGGNFVGFDSDFVGDGAGNYNSPLIQTISGLTVGKIYELSYYWAATQLQNRHGPTTDYMTVTFAGDTRSTPVVAVADQGFVGWTKVTERFTATSATDTLSFLAFGAPAGLPPFALLDGVSLSAVVPEPATWAMLIAGFGMVGAAARRRRHTTVAA